MYFNYQLGNNCNAIPLFKYRSSEWATNHTATSKCCGYISFSGRANNSQESNLYDNRLHTKRADAAQRKWFYKYSVPFERCTALPLYRFIFTLTTPLFIHLIIFIIFSHFFHEDTFFVLSLNFLHPPQSLLLS